MTRFVLTLLVGLVVSLGALVSGGPVLANVLPDVSPEEQYRFSLGRALANDLVIAEAAFDEFRKVNKGHERLVDATFWLGRVQFMREKYEHAAITFSEFNKNFPTDNRLVSTTMWIAESISHFATREQACKIYASLPELLDNPPKSFMTQLGALASAAKCGETAIASSKRAPKFAETFECKRYTDDSYGFTTHSVFESWFPKRISLETYEWRKAGGSSKALLKSENNKKYRLLPNGTMIAGMKQKPGFKTVDNVRYKCDRTSLQLTAGLERKSGDTRTASSSSLKDSAVCVHATFFNHDSLAQEWEVAAQNQKHVQEAKRRGLSCGVGVTTQTASAPVPKAKPTVTSAALTAYQKEAERLRQDLRQELAALKAQQQQQQQTIANDTQVPLITITQSGADGRKGSVKGFAEDNVQVAEVLIDGQAVRVGNDGSFEWSGFVPSTGKEITIEAIDTAALSSTKTVILKRGQIQQASGPRFDVLDPTAGKKVKRNSNALALIVGISDYKRTDAPAVYADKDAQYFHDYASLKLGISDSNIKTMVNAKAEQGDVILAVKDWMRRSSKPGKTDVYVFFAGHGLASDDGEQMYLLPYDGRPRLLDDTAIARDRLFSDIASANPRSVTVFLDTCYSGTTRGTDMLIASRPIAIKALEQSIPDNFTVMTAARGDQTAKPLEEAKHGMFSYFLMKGMEGEADKNQDNKITAGELHYYVQQNVVQQSSGSQTPELQGDADRVLVRFQ